MRKNYLRPLWAFFYIPSPTPRTPRCPSSSRCKYLQRPSPPAAAAIREEKKGQGQEQRTPGAFGGKPINGKVGLFWVLPTEDPSRPRLLISRTLLDNAYATADFLTHDTDHAAYWSRLYRLGPANLTWRGLPTEPALHRHDDFPQGHVAYDLARDRFVIFAPLFLERPDLHLAIAPAFGLTIGDYLVRPARHYHRAIAA